METKTKTFKEKLNSGSAENRAERAALYSSQMETAQRNLVGTLTNEVSSIKIKMSNLLDLAPDNTQKLLPKSEQFDAKEMADKYQALSIELENKEFELTVAMKNLEFFTVV